MRIDGERLLEDLRRLRCFGAVGKGVVRRSFSTVDMQSRRWLRDRMQEAGLRATIDGVGNVIGMAMGASRTLLIGSHTDTQPQGGWLDGTLGVIYGLEIARALRDENPYPTAAIDVASWMDEEGRFLTCLGSRSFCADIGPQEFEHAVDAEGMLLPHAIEEVGLTQVSLSRLDRGRHLGYLEAHIEQGCVLENSGKRLGIVTAIVGGAAFRITLHGQQNHAGTTPMALRRDAGRALLALAAQVDAEFQRLSSPQTVWTFGDVRFSPGATNIIPGWAEACLEFRDPSAVTIERFTAALHRLVAAAGADGCIRTGIEPLGKAATPAQMDPDFRLHLARAAERQAPGATMELPSGAGHDAAVFADRIPTGMLFVPSIGGISHSFEENTAEEDIVLGCQVLADAVAGLLDEAH